MHAVLQILILAAGLLAIHGASLENSDRRTDLLKDVGKLENLRSSLEGMLKIKRAHHSGQGSAESEEECHGPFCIIFQLAERQRRNEVTAIIACDIRDALREVGTPAEILSLINEIKSILAAFEEPSLPVLPPA